MLSILAQAIIVNSELINYTDEEKSIRISKVDMKIKN